MSDPKVCFCAPGVCLAAADGFARGRMSQISDIECRRANELNPEATPASPEGLRYNETPLTVVVDPPVSAVDMLNAAARHIGDRAVQYDKPQGERSMAATVAAFNAVTSRGLGRALTESEGWLFMELLKAVRDFSTPEGHPDSQEDRVAYAALGAEARRAGR